MRHCGGKWAFRDHPPAVGGGGGGGGWPRQDRFRTAHMQGQHAAIQVRTRRLESQINAREKRMGSQLQRTD